MTRGATVDRVHVTRHRYAVDGWDVGELIVSDGVVLAHELPNPALALSVSISPSRTTRGASENGQGADGKSRRATELGRSAVGGASFQASGPPSPKGGASPPEVTLAGEVIRVCADFVPNCVGRPGPGSVGEEGAAGEPGDPREGDLVLGVVARVRAQLEGDATAYGDVPLDLSWCTEFQGDLARALRGVPWGEIVSYGELAALAGRPGAARAAGWFCARNRYALMLPCHRVVSASGIGGYGDTGPQLKRRLLALEGIEL